MYDLVVVVIVIVVVSRSRPRVSTVDPYSEPLLSTVKYHPSCASEGFKSLDEACKWVKAFVY
ncbi:hypothetical protein H4J52_13600 [Colwellia sp. MB02u-14]|nr:hypothetical protein [Colwellia sp. MB02u-14]MBA6304375.1 hypothetical protein [Colwellia sp. MB02u-14]